MNKPFFYIIIITTLLASCSRNYKIAKVIPGETTIKETLELLDEPIRAKTSSFDEKSEIFIWKDISVQFQKSVVSAVHRSPSSIESSLQYWRHRYAQDESELKKIQEKSSRENLWQLNYKSQGISLIYNERDDRVIKVINYEVH